MRRARSILAKAALALASCALCVLALEMAWRIFLFGGDAFSYRKMDSLRDFGRAGLVQPAEHPEIIFELKPELDTWYKLVPFRTNSRGLRDEEYPLKKPPATVRVAVVGDSYTMPAGVRLEDAFHTRLEARLDEASPRLRYEFLNFGVAGYFLRQYRAVIREKALAYDPDLLLIGFCGRNDHHIRPEHLYHERYRPKPVEHPFFHPTFFEKLVRAFQFRVLERRNPGAHQSVDRQLRYLREHFGAIAERSEHASLPVVVALLNTRPSPLREELERIVERAGLHFVDASAPLVGRDPDAFAIYRTDEHPNAKAHRIFADEIHDFLVEKDLLARAVAGRRTSAEGRASPASEAPAPD